MDQGKKLPRIEILPIGREILTGRIQEKHAGWIAARVASQGGMVHRITVVDDDEAAIAAELIAAANRETKILIVTGGMGPTFDDITLKALAKGASIPLELTDQARDFVAKKYRELFERKLVPHPDMSPEREKMAWLPKGATMLHNETGAAPGARFEYRNVTVFVLPGPPKEFEPMYMSAVDPEIREALKGRALCEMTFPTDIADESVLTPICERINAEHDDTLVKSNATFFGDTKGLSVTVTVWGENTDQCREKVERLGRELENELKNTP